MDSLVVLVRHADSVPPTVGGPSEFERPLSRQGTVEADRLVEHLNEFSFVTAASSPYRRALATIEPTAAQHRLEIERWPQLREWESGLSPSPQWETPYRAAWRAPESRHGSGESISELTTRAHTTMSDALDFAARTGPLLLAGHGTWISRALLAHAIDVTIEFWLNMPMPAVYVWRRDRAGLHITGPGI